MQDAWVTRVCQTPYITSFCTQAKKLKPTAIADFNGK
eukprot:gene5343-15505_t